VGAPGVLSAFVAAAGARVRDGQTRPAAAPLPGSALVALARRHGIEPEACDDRGGGAAIH